MERILQIIHVSDFHMAVGSIPPRLGFFITLSRYNKQIKKFIRTRTAPFDPMASRKFLKALVDYTTGRYSWNGETWLVFTGDLTTFGDDKSLKMGMSYLEKIEQFTPKIYMMHGNHDAWPGDFPALFVSTSPINLQRKKLRTDFFKQRWPEKPLILDTDSVSIQLYGLNTVCHDKWRNSLAIGSIKHERYWERFKVPAKLHQLYELEELVKQYWENKPTLRILTTHHPIIDPGHLLPISRLKRKEEIAEEIEKMGFHVVLSGHTHKLYPELNSLRATNKGRGHTSSTENILQLTIGSLMQEAFSSPAEKKKRDWPHQAQI